MSELAPAPVAAGPERALLAPDGEPHRRDDHCGPSGSPRPIRLLAELSDGRQDRAHYSNWCSAERVAMSRRRPVPEDPEKRAAWYAAAPDVHTPCPPASGCTACAEALVEWQALWNTERPEWVRSDRVEAATREVLVEQYRAAMRAPAAG